MANLSESELYEAGIYQLEVTDPVLGGATGISNTPARQLANRTNWLRARSKKALLLGDVKDVSGNYVVVASDAGKVLRITDMAISSIALPAVSAFPTNEPITLFATDSTSKKTVAITANGAEALTDETGTFSSVYKISPGQKIVLINTGSGWLVLMVIQGSGYGKTPAGAILTLAVNNAPDGYLRCNGASVSRTLYADLFAVVSTTFGGGDGFSTFNLPDYRGTFLRDIDDLKGYDSGRSIGSYQADEFASHSHGLTVASSDSGTGSLDDGSGNAGTRFTSFAGGSETRPKNTSVATFIKY